MTFEVIFWAKLDFEIFCSAVITTEGLTLDASRALLRHKNFDGKSNMPKIEKDSQWIGWPSERIILTFEVIFWAKLDFEMLCSAVITTEGLTLDAFRALLRHKKFWRQVKVSKIEKDDWLCWLSGSLKMSFEVIFWAKFDFEIFFSVIITAEGLTIDASRALLRHKNLALRSKWKKIYKDE